MLSDKEFTDAIRYATSCYIYWWTLVSLSADRIPFCTYKLFRKLMIIYFSMEKHGLLVKSMLNFWTTTKSKLNFTTCVAIQIIESAYAHIWCYKFQIVPNLRCTQHVPRFPRKLTVFSSVQNEGQAVGNHDQRGSDLVLDHVFVFPPQNLQAVRVYISVRMDMV